MSRKFLAQASVMSLALILTGCGGDDSSTPLAGGNNSSSGGGDGGTDSGQEQSVALELGTGSGSDFQSGQIKASASDLSSGGTTRLEFNVVNAADGNAIYNAEETAITITSLCENAVFDSPITTTSGQVSTAYEAGCSGPDTITARLDNGATAITNITVAPQEANSLDFISVEPDSIAISGSSDSSRRSFSEVTFKLVDNNGKPVEARAVDFSLSTTVGGINLSQKSAETGPQGEAKTRVNAGSVPSVVSVTATTELANGNVVQTTSDPISISASIPDQDSFSVAVQKNFLPNARFHDDVEVGITISAADRNNNQIGSAVVNFLTNAGAVPSECQIQGGVCSIKWRSQNPRVDSSIVRVLARTVGEESFRDLNSDGKYTGTPPDSFDVASNDRSEAFLDRNGNQVRDSDEEYFDYNSNGQFDGPNSVYNGTACASDDDSVCTTQLLEVSETARFFMASDTIDITVATGFPVTPANTVSSSTALTPGVVCAEVTGLFEDSEGTTVQGPPPGGTEVAFSTTNGSIVAPASFNTPTDFRTTPVTTCATVEGDDESDSGTLTIEVTPPAPFSGDPYRTQREIRD